MESDKLLQNYEKATSIEETEKIKDKSFPIYKKSTSLEENEQIEEKLLVYSPKPISFEENEKIVEQMKFNPICIIHGIKTGHGFFIRIPFPDDNNYLTVLMTNNHIIDKSYLKKNRDIIISHNNVNDKMQLKLKDRIIYTNKDYDITIIEIKENDDNINFFLELDKNIDKNFSYYGETIYNLQYYQLRNLSASFGIANRMDNKENKKSNFFLHFCNTEPGTSGSPLLLLSTNKVIGIHKAAHKKYSSTIGLFLNEAIIDFNEKNKVKMEKIINSNIKRNQMKELIWIQIIFGI